MRAAIIGLGTIAKTHVAAWERLGGVELIVGVDVADVGRWRFAGRDVPVYRTIEELAAHQPDCVVVATPTATHHQVCVAVLECVKARVLVEKPLASTLGDSLALLDRQQAADHLVVLYHAAYAPEVGWASQRLSRWLDQFGPIRSFDCLFADPHRDDPDAAAQRYVSSWVDSGINCLSVLARLVRLEEVVDVAAVDERASVYEASVRFTSRGADGRGRIRTSWDVQAAHKHTLLRFEADSIQVVLDHQQVSGAVTDGRGATIERFQFDGALPRLVSHYVNLYDSVLLGRQPYVFGAQEHRRLCALLFAGQ